MQLREDAFFSRALTFRVPDAPLTAIHRRARMQALRLILQRTLLCAAAVLAFSVASHAPASSVSRVPTPLPAPSSHVNV